MSSGFSPVPGDKFTDEILAKNFMAIAAGFQDMEQWVSHLQEHVTDLLRAAEAASKVKVKKPGRVKPFLVGAAVGITLYRYVKANGHKPIVTAVNNWAADVQEQAKDVAESAKDVVNDARD